MRFMTSIATRWEREPGNVRFMSPMSPKVARKRRSTRPEMAAGSYTKPHVRNWRAVVVAFWPRQSHLDVCRLEESATKRCDIQDKAHHNADALRACCTLSRVVPLLFVFHARDETLASDFDTLDEPPGWCK